MSHGFLKDWDRESNEAVFSRIGGKLHHKTPLKEQISSALYRIRVQHQKLESTSMRMQQHDRDIFAKCVSAQMTHDTARAAMYANECAEVRKIAKVTLQCELALEQVALRLETIEEFGDVARMMAPVAGVVHSIRNQIAGVVPEVGFELAQIGEVLNGLVSEVGEATGTSYDMQTTNADAQGILNEASALAEQNMKERFPELPSGVISSQRTGEAGIQH